MVRNCQGREGGRAGEEGTVSSLGQPGQRAVHHSRHMQPDRPAAAPAWQPSRVTCAAQGAETPVALQTCLDDKPNERDGPGKALAERQPHGAAGRGRHHLWGGTGHGNAAAGRTSEPAGANASTCATARQGQHTVRKLPCTGALGPPPHRLAQPARLLRSQQHAIHDRGGGIQGHEHGNQGQHLRPTEGGRGARQGRVQQQGVSGRARGRSSRAAQVARCCRLLRRCGRHSRSGAHNPLSQAAQRSWPAPLQCAAGASPG